MNKLTGHDGNIKLKNEEFSALILDIGIDNILAITIFSEIGLD